MTARADKRERADTALFHFVPPWCSCSRRRRYHLPSLRGNPKLGCGSRQRSSGGGSPVAEAWLKLTDDILDWPRTTGVHGGAAPPNRPDRTLSMRPSVDPRFEESSSGSDAPRCHCSFSPLRSWWPSYARLDPRLPHHTARTFFETVSCAAVSSSKHLVRTRERVSGRATVRLDPLGSSRPRRRSHACSCRIGCVITVSPTDTQAVPITYAVALPARRR